MMATLVPPHVAVRECLIAGVAGVLADEESRCVAMAVPKRQQEFLAGRLCAHAALCELGMPRMALPSRADRTPAWPDPVVGSITHSERHCAAAVALRSRVRAEANAVDVYCFAEIAERTGVEMEALTGLNIALLTIWDLVKPVNAALEITNVRLLYKSGGKRGTWIHPDGLTDEVKALIEEFTAA